jgi:hypothetical protein
MPFRKKKGILCDAAAGTTQSGARSAAQTEGEVPREKTRENRLSFVAFGAEFVMNRVETDSTA